MRLVQTFLAKGLEEGSLTDLDAPLLLLDLGDGAVGPGLVGHEGASDRDELVVVRSALKAHHTGSDSEESHEALLLREDEPLALSLALDENGLEGGLLGGLLHRPLVGELPLEVVSVFGLGEVLQVLGHALEEAANVPGAGRVAGEVLGFHAELDGIRVTDARDTRDADAQALKSQKKGAAALPFC
jgi:hypothetical protein